MPSGGPIFAPLTFPLCLYYCFGILEESYTYFSGTYQDRNKMDSRLQSVLRSVTTSLMAENSLSEINRKKNCSSRNKGRTHLLLHLFIFYFYKPRLADH